MKTHTLTLFLAGLALAAALLLVGTLTGCATGASGTAPLIQKILDDLLAPGFTGPAHLETQNQYFTVIIDAGGLRRVDGRWTWDWISYDGTSHIPIFAGVNLSSTSRISVGDRLAVKRVEP